MSRLGAAPTDTARPSSRSTAHQAEQAQQVHQADQAEQEQGVAVHRHAEWVPSKLTNAWLQACTAQTSKAWWPCVGSVQNGVSLLPAMVAPALP